MCGESLGRTCGKRLIDNVALGRVLGKIQALEWAPAQRISGLVVEMLINRSSFHNKELSVLFVSFLSCLPENPVKDLKRLLEVFAELQTVNNWPKVTYAPLLCLLETWKKNSKLTEVIDLCIKNDGKISLYLCRNTIAYFIKRRWNIKSYYRRNGIRKVPSS